MSARSMIDALGGRARVARDLSLPHPVVWNWYERNSIPAGRWASFVALARSRREKSITLEALASLASQTADPR